MAKNISKCYMTESGWLVDFEDGFLRLLTTAEPRTRLFQNCKIGIGSFSNCKIGIGSFSNYKIGIGSFSKEFKTHKIEEDIFKFSK